MADGDIVHGKINNPYIAAYKWICEGKASIDECTKKLLRSIKTDLKVKGRLPLILAKALGAFLEVTCQGSTNFNQISQGFEDIAYETQGPHYLKELVLNAARQVLHSYRYSEQMAGATFTESILKNYLVGVYEGGFSSRVAILAEHHNGAPRSEVLIKVHSMEGDIDSTLDKWSKKLAQTGDFSKLRMPRKKNNIPISLDENLL